MNIYNKAVFGLFRYAILCVLVASTIDSAHLFALHGNTTEDFLFNKTVSLFGTSASLLSLLHGNSTNKFLFKQTVHSNTTRYSSKQLDLRKTIEEDEEEAYSKYDPSKENCKVFNFSFPALGADCSPGSMYIIKCRQCICPYIGSADFFCRALPKEIYCEEPFPGGWYTSRRQKENTTDTLTSNASSEGLFTGDVVNHIHTKYHCKRPGTIEDACYKCECEEDRFKYTIIEEHCFKNNDTKCLDESPTFLTKKLS